MAAAGFPADKHYSAAGGCGDVMHWMPLPTKKGSNGRDGSTSAGKRRPVAEGFWEKEGKSSTIKRQEGETLPAASPAHRSERSEGSGDHNIAIHPSGPGTQEDPNAMAPEDHGQRQVPGVIGGVWRWLAGLRTQRGAHLGQ
ncbi:hypothetical protein NDU88_011520 [Pleurodeles waltl]|uniref:Uncharacterized protein n=1 Tax=Pleurodeles waltl TaxID=8319 RepID=A0AAV7QXH6_PLEWA|nr:hypothetical protein NDU88_011520 [Pleurodeles waltl]